MATMSVLDPFTPEELKRFTVVALPADIASREVVVSFDLEAGSTRRGSPFAIGIVVFDLDTEEVLGAFRIVCKGDHLTRFLEGKFDMEDRTEKFWSTQKEAIDMLSKLVNTDATPKDMYRLWVTVMNTVKPDTKAVTDAAAFDSQVLASIAWDYGSPFTLGTDKIINNRSVYTCVDEAVSTTNPIAADLLTFQDGLKTGKHDPLFDAAQHLFGYY